MGSGRSDDLEAVAEGRMPSSQQPQCGWKRWDIAKNQDPNTRIAQVRVHLWGSPQLKIG